MRHYYRFLPLLAYLVFQVGCTSEKETKTVEASKDTEQVSSLDSPVNKQIIVVLTEGWDTPEGTLWSMEWADTGWEPHLSDIPVLIGRNGLAWGKGLEDYRTRSGPKKQEGDKRSPAGVYALGTAFGYAEQLVGGTWPYTPVVASTMCIEDGASTYYNKIVDEHSVTADWNSTDHMLREDDLYEWGVHVMHNSGDTQAGDGSCIFLHVWRENGSGTAGCTSLDKATLLNLIKWLSPESQPLIIQVPKSEWAFLQQAYQLPAL